MKQNTILLVILSFLGVTNLAAQSFAQILCRMEGESFPRQVSLVTADRGRPANYAVTTVSPGGTFGFVTDPLPQQQFFYLYDGSRYFRIFLHAGNTVKVGWRAGKFSFSDPGNPENEVLQRWNRIESRLPQGKTQDYAAFFAVFDSVKTEADLLIGQLQKTNNPFAAQIKSIIQTDLFYRFVTYISKNQQVYDSDEQKSTYFQMIMPRFPETTGRLLLQPYGIALMKAYFDYKQTYVYRQQSFTLEQQLGEIDNKALREEYILSRVPNTDYADYRKFEDTYLPHLSADNRGRLRNDVPRPLSELVPGSPAPNLIYPDSVGRLRSLSEFRGKYVYVDIWATWCAPCKAEIPHLKQLEKRFADNNIVFVSISIDKNNAVWKRFVKDRRLGGVQLWAGDWTALPKEMDLGSVPRFLLIDPDGNWVAPNAARPSDARLAEMLTSLSKKK